MSDNASRYSPTIRDVLDRLYEYYGRPEYDGSDDLLAVLIRTILSQNTTRINTDRAFGRLVDRFHGDWQRIEKAPVDDVVDAIEIGGLANQKAPRIQRILGQIKEKHGEYSLTFLRDKDADDARDYLLEFKGVGPKTAAFALMDAADFEVFPMDTHILRICKRFGWIDESTTSKAAHRLMEPEIPDGEHYSAHIVIVKHGREICNARNPECGGCPLSACCPTGQRRVG